MSGLRTAEGMSHPAGSQAVDRAAQLLTLVVRPTARSASPSWSRTPGWPARPRHRLLAALEANHLLERDATGAYRSGALFALLRRAARPLVAGRRGSPIRCCDDVGGETGETVNLARAPRRRGRADRAGRLHLHARRPRLDAGRRAAALLGAGQGALRLRRAAAARRPARAAHRALAARLPRRCCSASSTPSGARGYALTRDELEIGLDGVAVPVRGAGRHRGRRPRRLGPELPGSDRQLDELGRLLTKHGQCAVAPAPTPHPHERRGMTIDTGRDPAGPLRLHPGGQRTRGARAHRRGRWRSGMEPQTLLFDALIPSLEEVGARFERGDFFVPEMLIAGRAMAGAMEVLRPLLADTGVQTDRQVPDGHRQGRRPRHRQEPRQHHARGCRLRGDRPRRAGRAGEVRRRHRASTSPTSSASRRSSPRPCRCSRPT